MLKYLICIFICIFVILVNMSILSYLQDTRGCIFYLVSKMHFECIFPTPVSHIPISTRKRKLLRPTKDPLDFKRSTTHWVKAFVGCSIVGHGLKVPSSHRILKDRSITGAAFGDKSVWSVFRVKIHAFLAKADPFCPTIVAAAGDLSVQRREVHKADRLGSLIRCRWTNKSSSEMSELRQQRYVWFNSSPVGTGTTRIPVIFGKRNRLVGLIWMIGQQAAWRMINLLLFIIAVRQTRSYISWKACQGSLPRSRTRTTSNPRCSRRRFRSAVAAVDDSSPPPRAPR